MVAGRDRRTWFSGFDVNSIQGQRQDRGSRPADALLFIQAAIKSKQKGPFSCGGHGIRGRRLVVSPVQQLTGWRLRSTERQRPQLNEFRWAGLVRRCFVGSGSGNDKVGLLKLANARFLILAFPPTCSAGICNSQAVPLAHRHRRQERSSKTRPLSNPLTV